MAQYVKMIDTLIMIKRLAHIRLLANYNNN